MATAQGPDGTETTLRVVVFRDGDMYIAQCLEYDIAAQAPDVDSVLDRIDLTICAEFKICDDSGKTPKECIAPAPNQYHDLWDKKSLVITKVNHPMPDNTLITDIRLAQAA